MNGTDKSGTRPPNRVATAGRTCSLHPRAGQADRRADAARRTAGRPGGRIFSARPDPAVRLSSSTRKAISGTSYVGTNRFPANGEGLIVIPEWLIATSAAQAMGRLTARHQTLLTCGLGLSYSEVAGPMGLPIGSINPMPIQAIRMLDRREWSIWVQLPH